MHERTDTTGLDLKLERTALRVKANCVAREMGVVPSRITAIEKDDGGQTRQLVERYRAALATCVTSGTSPRAA